MAKNNIFSNRGTLRYEMQKQLDRYNRNMHNQVDSFSENMKKYQNATLQKKYDEGGVGDKALKAAIAEIKEANKNVTREKLNSLIEKKKEEFKEKRQPIENQFKDDFKAKLLSLRQMIETTPVKYNVVNDELDPGITLLGNPRKQKTPNVHDDTKLKEFHN